MDLYKIHTLFYPNMVLDIGANVGQFRLEFNKVYPQAYIFSIEASNECEPYLKEITNDYYIGLLARDNSQYSYYSRKDYPTGTGNSIYRELTHFYSEDKLEIVKKQGIKLDDLFEDHTEFDLIKIDTQGSELDIIEGGKNICSKAKAMLLEVSLTQYNENAPLFNDVINYMDNFGFYQKCILDESRNHGSHQQDILFVNKNFK